MSMDVKLHLKQRMMEKQVFLFQFYYQHNRKKWSALVLEMLMDSFNGSAPQFFLLENITKAIFCVNQDCYFNAAESLGSQHLDPEMSRKMTGAGFLFHTDNTLEDNLSSATGNLFKWSLN